MRVTHEPKYIYTGRTFVCVHRYSLSSTDVLIAENPATNIREEIVNTAIEQGNTEIRS